ATVAGGAEVAAYDPMLRLAFVMGPNGVDILTAVSRPGKPAGTILASIDLSAFAGSANAIAFRDGLLAVAVAGPDKTQPGTVLTYHIGGEVSPITGFRPTITPKASFIVGANPDQMTFTPDGTKLLVANEGEPSGYRPGDADPNGSVSVIDLLSGTVRTADFTAFNSQIDALRAAGVRIFGPRATVAQDLEPEYVTVSADGKTAFVALQENNAIAVLDIATATVVSILPLGLKNHAIAGQGLDASDRDGPSNGPAINIRPWPVLGMYQPDGMATFTFGGVEYLATANEGDARDWPGFNEEVRVGAASYTLDPAAFPNASVLKQAANLGRLTVSNA
ncbi:MAG: choice-of-anchor I family protein, partial [Elioraea sp.]|nr:choice-of-anchor I family protein [Elioraea sp.]